MPPPTGWTNAPSANLDTCSLRSHLHTLRKVLGPDRRSCSYRFLKHMKSEGHSCSKASSPTVFSQKFSKLLKLWVPFFLEWSCSPAPPPSQQCSFY